jgi:hypothetical protein
MGGAQPSHGRHEAPKHAPALFGHPHTYVPILGEAVLLQVLKREPIHFANVKLAFSDLLQGPLFGRAELDLGNGFHGGDLSRPAPVRIAAGWRMGLCTSQRPDRR